MIPEPIPLDVTGLTLDRTQMTRHKLVVAGLKLFGQQGFDATTTRQISEAAEANVAAISYHFGSKDNLRIEVARSVATLMKNRGAERMIAHLDNAEIAALSPDQARTLIRGQMSTVLDPSSFGPMAEDVLRFFHYEITRESAAADMLFHTAMEGNLERMCRLVAQINGQPWDSETTRLAALMVFGQVMIFSLTRPLALRALGWSKIGPDEQEAILSGVWLN